MTVHSSILNGSEIRFLYFKLFLIESLFLKTAFNLGTLD
jgi:hypothetical protein